MSQIPPKLPLKIFRWFCSDERLEELEGDLFEVYNEFINEKGVRFSKVFYWWIVIRSFRSYALKRKKMRENKVNNSVILLKHNIRIAWRNLLKHKTTAAINVLGLAIGIGAFLTIIRIVQFELSFNTQIPEKEKIHRIYTTFSGSFTSTNKGVAIPIGPYVEENFSGIEETSYFQTYSSVVEIPGENEAMKDFGRQSQLVITDESYFKVIDQYEWLAGSIDNALDEPFKVVLTDQQARAYFGNISWLDMIGKRIVYSDSLNVYVSAIVKQPAYNTDFVFTDFISYATIENSWLKDRYDLDQWGNTNSSSQLFIKLQENVSTADIISQLEGLDKQVDEQAGDSDWVQKYELQPLSDLHFNTELSTFDNGKDPAHLQTLIILGVVAFAILLIAIFNFINLETAQSTAKSKEVGVRKVLGSPKRQLISRFLTESFMISFFAVLLSIPLAHYGLIFFEEFVPDGVALNYSDSMLWVILVGLVIGVGFVAGIYPSLIISSYKPVIALNSGGTTKGPKNSILRKSLIFFQFLFSQLLIVGTLAIIWQISFMLDKELGFNEEGVMYFYTPYYESYNKQKLILDEVEKMPEILDYSIQNTPPAQRGYSTSTVKYESPQGEVVTSAHRKSGDTTYLRFYDIELLAGRNLIPNDTLPELLINETFMQNLGFEDPREAVGASFEYNDRDHTVVGVIKDFHFRSLHNPIEPMLYVYEAKSRCVALKIPLDDNLQSTIASLTDKWDEVYPKTPLKVYFMDDTIERFYETERKASKLASTATGIAILISCLGLFGLISYTIVQKSKEMGIRKVLGASIYQIGTILSKEFIYLILIAFLVSTPISYYFISTWMEDFAYKTEISWWIYLLGGIASMLIALASISVKVWKASGSNPIESLRYE